MNTLPPFRLPGLTKIRVPTADEVDAAREWLGRVSPDVAEVLTARLRRVAGSSPALRDH